MEMNVWERIFYMWQSTFFMNFFVIGCLIFCLVVSFKNKQNDRVFHLFTIYTIFTLSLFTVNDIAGIISYFCGRSWMNINEVTNIIYATIEMIVFYNFFKLTVSSKLYNRVLKIFMYSYLATIVLYLIKVFDSSSTPSSIRSYSDRTLTIEFIFLTISCLVYYYELFKAQDSKDLLKSPSFWIVSGLFFYCLIVTPFFFITNELYFERRDLYDILFAIHYFFIGILFICISKAILCKKQLTK